MCQKNCLLREDILKIFFYNSVLPHPNLGQKTWMPHISVETNVPNNKSEWLEPVDDKTFAEAK